MPTIAHTCGPRNPSSSAPSAPVPKPSNAGCETRRARGVDRAIGSRLQSSSRGLTLKYTFVVTGLSAYRLDRPRSTNERLLAPPGEVLRAHLVDELGELLDELLVFFLVLVEHDARLVEHALLGVDRHRRARAHG